MADTKLSALSTGTIAATSVVYIVNGTTSAKTTVSALQTYLASAFAASSHSHAIADVTSLQSTLDAKAASSHSHAIADVTGLQAAIDGKAASSHTHTSGDVSDFAEAVDDRVDTLLVAGTNIDSITYDDGAGTLTINASTQAGGGDHGGLTGLGDDDHAQYALADGTRGSFAATTHTHAIADVTGLQTALNGKAASSHTHTSGDVSDFAEAVDDRVDTLLVAGTNIDSITYDDGAGTLTINASTQAGGGDHGGLTGLTDDDHAQYALADGTRGSFAASSHNHAAGDINSGTLAHERGGLEADASAFDGLVRITGGATTAVTVTAFGLSLIDDADAATARATLGAAASSHNHATGDINSGTLAHERGGLEADASAFDGLVRITGGATTAATVTTFGLSLIDDADADTARATLDAPGLSVANVFSEPQQYDDTTGNATGNVAIDLDDPEYVLTITGNITDFTFSNGTVRVPVTVYLLQSSGNSFTVATTATLRSGVTVSSPAATKYALMQVIKLPDSTYRIEGYGVNA